MTEPKDIAARDLIRDAHGQTFFVEAGAGTGKTTALVARVVEMVATGHLSHVGGLAAITFTENAAAELRNRVREGLEAAARGRHGERAYDEAARRRAAAAVAALDDATITTLHGFAARILTDVPLEAGLPPGFGVNDAIRSRLDALAAWRRFVDELLDDDAVAEHVLAGLTLGLTLGSLREVADAFAASWDQLEPRPFAEVPLPAIDAAPVVRALAHAASYADAGPEGDTLTAHLREVVVPAVEQLTALADPFDVLESLSLLKVSTRCGSAQAWTAAGVDKDDVLGHLRDAREARDAVVGAVGEAVTETLAARVQDFVLGQARARQERGRLDFHDLLVLTRDLLRSDAEVRHRLHTRFPVVLVDEFQDTDPLQVEIVCLVTGEWEGVGGVGGPPPTWRDIEVPAGRLFFVGDAKQSIYRFRRADVGLFTEVGAKHGAGRIRLDVNFRSVPGIVDAVNAVFTELIGGADEGQVPYADLVAHREGTGDAPVVGLLGGPDPSATAAVLRDAEAEHLAATIARAKAEGWPVEDDSADRSGRAGRPTRPASYADMAVLLPTRTPLPALEAALQARDVPYRVESRSLVWATDAVRDLVTLLQAIDSPADEVALVAALRHPGLACSDVDLAAWAAAGGRWSYLAPAPDGIGPEHPVAAAMVTLRRLHDLRWWLPVNELVGRVVRELRLVELTASLRRPRDHWRRLRFVVDQARAFADAGGAGLTDFVAWAIDQVESEADALETVVPEPDDDAVRILTIHGSKGLEFPVTFVAGLGGATRSGAPVLWGGQRPQVRLRKDVLETAGYAGQQRIEKELDAAEAVRLLYVAMTRAMDRLVLGCYFKPTSGGRGSHAERLWALLARSPLAVVEAAPAPAATPVPPTAEPAWALGSADRDRVAAERGALLDDVRRRVATTATGLVEEGPTAGEPAPERGVELVDAEVSGPVGPPVASRGAAVGTAVHWVLEQVRLHGWTDDEVRRLAEVACAELEIDDLVPDVARRARTVLATPLVASAGQRGRFWREVYVVARDGHRVVEGYVDLLVEDPDGRLVVVDYKTDRVGSQADVAAKVQHYRPQLAAYARATEAATGRAVRDAALVFAGTGQARRVELAPADGAQDTSTADAATRDASTADTATRDAR